jgi:hypothetical protein
MFRIYRLYLVLTIILILACLVDILVLDPMQTVTADLGKLYGPAHFSAAAIPVVGVGLLLAIGAALIGARFLHRAVAFTTSSQPQKRMPWKEIVASLASLATVSVIFTMTSVVLSFGYLGLEDLHFPPRISGSPNWDLIQWGTSGALVVLLLVAALGWALASRRRAAR